MTGTPCHFIRLSGCNMWDGRPETRADSKCPFCDTDFFSHTMMTSLEIVDTLEELGTSRTIPWVTISGGEPALQVDYVLTEELHRAGYKIAIETNGTVPLKVHHGGNLMPFVNGYVDYVTISPKLPRAKLFTPYAMDCLKLLWPHPNPLIRPEAFDKDSVNAVTRYLQPIEDADPEVTRANVAATIAKLYELPGWKLSLQTHKYIGVE